MDKNNELLLFDRSEVDDSFALHKTVIKVFVEGTDECIFEGSNKVIVAGSIFTAAKHWNITPAIKTPTYNSVLSLENIDNTVSPTPGVRREEQVCLFAVGTDGCGADQSNVFVVDYKKWIEPAALVPFRYPLTASDLSVGLRSIYYGRKLDAAKSRTLYYFKTFESTPIFKQQFVDGTAIDEAIYSSSKPEAVEQYVEVKLKITKDDCREWFTVGVGINQAKVNTISLLTAWPKTYTGNIYYQDIRPMTKFNFPNEALIDVSKGLDVVYQIYY